MSLAAAMSAVHVLCLGIGLPAIWARARALRRGDAPATLSADNLWGLAAAGWVGSGLVRLLVTEKGWAFYEAQPMFWTKMALFGVIWVLEVWPMVTFVRWRLTGQPDLRHATWLARLSELELVLTLLLPFAASAMARGLRL